MQRSLASKDGAVIRNPVLPGFNPDPSFCRVGDDFYMATSTFEWYPGVQIHHSRDLVNWTLVARPLKRSSQLDLRGNPDSCGVWAPCLSWADGRFWLVYTNVKRFEGNFKDAHNYIVTAPTIDGPWSDPVYVNSSGFDPSLFHDQDGRKWFLNMQWDHRTGAVGGQPEAAAFDGILLQERDAERGRLVGPVTNIYRGTALGLVEGPHLFQRQGWYYLMTAEGGTGYSHAVTLARSRELQGPYETHPCQHVVSSKDAPQALLQRAGHGQLVQLDDGSAYLAHLCSRPLPGTRRSPRGRETALQRCVWRDDDWLYLEHGGMVPAVDVPAPFAAAEPAPRQPVRRSFAGCQSLPPEFQWLRTPEPERLFTLTGTALRLTGRESVGSWFEQSLVARRQEDERFRAETVVSRFAPDTYQQAAGLALYYNRHKFHTLMLTCQEGGRRVLSLLSCPGIWPDNQLQFPLTEPVALPAEGAVRLAAEVDGAALQFLADWGQGWQTVGPVLDASVISDEGGRGEHASFTGAFIGMLAFDTSGAARTADFTHFDYEPR